MKPKTLEQLLTQLKSIEATNPATLKMPIVTSRDDEGNGYNAVFFDPQIICAGELDIENCGAIDDSELVVLLN